MKEPIITTYDWNWVKVVEVIPSLGVFVDIGVSKDILIPADEFPIYMPVWPVGDELYCTLKLTNRDRLIALPARDSDMQEIIVDATPSMRNKT